jgi:DNA polymerase III delta subunit
MIQFIHGDDLPKINLFISDYLKKNNLNKITYSLNAENISEILGNIDTPNLFGEKNLFVVDITECEFEDLEKFVKALTEDSELILLYEGLFDQRSKSFKLLSKFKSFEFKLVKTSNIFAFTDCLLSGDLKKTYQELEKLNEAGEEDLMIFNMVVSTFRNLAAIKFDTKLKSKVPPFKIGLYTSASKRYTDDEIKNIYKILAENDLKFKTGEITSEMILLHSINTVLKNGTDK